MSLTISKPGPLRFNFILRNKKKSQVLLLKEQRFDVVKYIQANRKRRLTQFRNKHDLEKTLKGIHC